MVKPVPADGTSLRVCWSHLRAGPFPSELWEVLLLSFSNSFSSAAVHNHTPHPSPVSVDGTQHLYHTGGVRTTRLCSGREYTCRLAFVQACVPPRELFNRRGCGRKLGLVGGRSV